MRYRPIQVLLVALPFALSAGALDPWPHPGGQPERTFYTVAPALDAVSVHWTVDDVAEFPSTIIDGSGNVFCFTRQTSTYSLVSLNPDTGAVIDTYISGVADALGICTGGGMLYAVVDNVLVAWTVGNTTAGWSIHPEDLYTIPLATSSGDVCVAGFNAMYCYSSDGSQNWSYPLSAASLGQWPAILENGVFISADTNLYGVNLNTGTERFVEDATDYGYDEYNGWIMGGPNSRVWAGVMSGGQVWFHGGFNSLTGSLGPYFSFTDRTTQLHCITPADIFVFHGGTRLWVWDQAETDPTVDMDVGFNSSQISCASDAVYMGDTEGDLYCYGLDGTLRWSYTIGDSSHFTSTFIAIDSTGNLYVPLTGNQLCKVGTDIEPPVAGLSSIVINGFTDDLGSMPVVATIDGTDYPVDPGDGTFSGEVAVSASKSISVEVTDASSNQSSITVDVSIP